MTMPNMTGDILAKEFMKIRPDIPVIICTGFSEQISAEKVKAIGISGFLMKPLTIRELARTVRSVLDQK
jgi:DNA-binding NarL/FixJ family response regulator